jgi:alpha-glucosidase
MLWFYRDALRQRRELPALGAGDGSPVQWLELGDDVLAFRREPGLVCVVNTGSTPVPLPPGDVVIASVEPVDGQLPGDAAAWVTTP